MYACREISLLNTTSNRETTTRDDSGTMPPQMAHEAYNPVAFRSSISTPSRIVGLFGFPIYNSIPQFFHDTLDTKFPKGTIEKIEWPGYLDNPEKLRSFCFLVFVDVTIAISFVSECDGVGFIMGKTRVRVDFSTHRFRPPTYPTPSLPLYSTPPPPPPHLSVEYEPPSTPPPPPLLPHQISVPVPVEYDPASITYDPTEYAEPYSYNFSTVSLLPAQPPGFFGHGYAYGHDAFSAFNVRVHYDAYRTTSSFYVPIPPPPPLLLPRRHVKRVREYA